MEIECKKQWSQRMYLAAHLTGGLCLSSEGYFYSDTVGECICEY